MKLKHFAGYGTIEAKKIGKLTNNDGLTVLSVSVTGEHEQGLIPYHVYMYDDYLLKQWLIDRFDKKAKSINGLHFRTTVNDMSWNDTAVFTFVYRYDNTDRFPDSI